MIETSKEKKMSATPNRQSVPNNEELFTSSWNRTFQKPPKTTANNFKISQNNYSYLTPHYAHSFHFDFSPISNIQETTGTPLRTASKDSINISNAPSTESVFFLSVNDAVLFGEQFEWDNLDVSTDTDCFDSQKVVVDKIENRSASYCSSMNRVGGSCFSIWSFFSFVATLASFVACVSLVYIDFVTNCRICPGHEILYISVPALVLSAFLVVLKWNLTRRSTSSIKANMAAMFLQHLFGLIILCQESLFWPYKFFASSIIILCFLQIIFEQMNHEAKSFI